LVAYLISYAKPSLKSAKRIKVVSVKPTSDLNFFSGIRGNVSVTSTALSEDLTGCFLGTVSLHEIVTENNSIIAITNFIPIRKYINITFQMFEFKIQLFLYVMGLVIHHFLMTFISIAFIKPDKQMPIYSSHIKINMRCFNYTCFIKLVFILFLFQSCKSTTVLMKKDTRLADSNASKETVYTLNRIREIAKHGYAFGHQDATAYGIGWKNDGSLYKSDVNNVTGDYPAVYGFELGHLELGHSRNLDTVDFQLMKNLIQKAHKKGGLITLSWHPDNPVSKKSAWDTTPAVSSILKDGSLHELYREWLAKIANFLKDIKDTSGRPIPVVFRPFHEMNGNWFWWGKRHCSPEEYIRLWRETFHILTNEYQVHHIIYAYSPNTLNQEKEFLKYYPGDTYVDILGMDIYQHSTTSKFIKDLNRDLGLLKKIATQKNKPYVLSEGGLNKIPVSNWWTEVLDPNLSKTGISWALFWRNAWLSHHYVPYPDHKNAADFKAFKELPHVLFLKEVKKIR